MALNIRAFLGFEHPDVDLDAHMAKKKKTEGVVVVSNRLTTNHNESGPFDLYADQKKKKKTAEEIAAEKEQTLKKLNAL